MNSIPRRAIYGQLRSSSTQAALTALRPTLESGGYRADLFGVSWYRSPLLAGKPGKQIPDEQFPVHTADELLRYDSTYGMFDTSYAGAWELGRLLCLQNTRISVSLYRWKRTHIRSLKAMEQQYLHPHLPFQANASEKIVLPDHVETWLSEISLLKGLPFRYLVPDERMLPAVQATTSGVWRGLVMMPSGPVSNTIILVTTCAP
ncbi:hypothetical protein [Candidatus Chloroploca asiatica]|nr:hypothetical protein [Candidatus Chloroploca asiatica]